MELLGWAVKNSHHQEDTKILMEPPQAYLRTSIFQGRLILYSEMCDGGCPASSNVVPYYYLYCLEVVVENVRFFFVVTLASKSRPFQLEKSNLFCVFKIFKAFLTISTFLEKFLRFYGQNFKFLNVSFFGFNFCCWNFHQLNLEKYGLMKYVQCLFLTLILFVQLNCFFS